MPTHWAIQNGLVSCGLPNRNAMRATPPCQSKSFGYRRLSRIIASVLCDITSRLLTGKKLLATMVIVREIY